MRRLAPRAALLAGLLSLASSAWAGPYTADFSFQSSLAGSTITHALTIDNTDGAGHTLDFFRILLDADASYDHYSNLAWIDDQSLSGWSSYALDQIGGFGGTPAELGEYRIPGINDGASLQVAYSFDYSGALTQAQQLFTYEAYFGVCFTSDPNCTSGIEDPSGYFRYLGMETSRLDYIPPTQPPDPVPEPVTLALMGIGLMGLALSRRRF